MADTKITALTSISTSTDPATDVFAIVDTDDFIMSGTGTTKKVTTNQLLGAGGTASFATLAVSGATTLTGAATVQGLTVGKGASAIASNTAFGTSVLASNIAAQHNTGTGYLALDAVTTGGNNSAFGSSALGTLVGGTNNTAIGFASLFPAVSSIECTAVGALAGYTATGSYTTAIGASALQTLAAGDYNTAVGNSAGKAQTSGSNNGLFGYNAQADILGGDNQYVYGNINVATHKFRAGDVVVGNGNVVMSTIGKGIDFSATSHAGTMTSELLADYEEGTWVPTDASGAGLAITGAACRYTKIGRAVTIQGTITYPTTANTTASRIAGIPFAFSDIAPMNISYIGAGGSTVFYFMGFSANELEFYGNAANGITNATLSTLSIRFFGTYYI